MNLAPAIEHLQEARRALDETDGCPLGKIDALLDKITREVDRAIGFLEQTAKMEAEETQ